MNVDWVFCSEARLRATVISTMLPDEIFGGRRIEGNSIYEVNFAPWIGGCQVRLGAGRGHTSLLSCVSRTATPASTLPTVNEISMLIY